VPVSGFIVGVLKTLRHRLIDFFARAAQSAWRALRGGFAPASNHGAVTGLLFDVIRSRREPTGPSRSSGSGRTIEFHSMVLDLGDSDLETEPM
jgi:hypothetical protein